MQCMTLVVDTVTCLRLFEIALAYQHVLLLTDLFEAEGHCQNADSDDAVGHRDDRLKFRHFETFDFKFSLFKNLTTLMIDLFFLCQLFQTTSPLFQPFEFIIFLRFQSRDLQLF